MFLQTGLVIFIYPTNHSILNNLNTKIRENSSYFRTSKKAYNKIRERSTGIIRIGEEQIDRCILLHEQVVVLSEEENITIHILYGHDRPMHHNQIRRLQTTKPATLVIRNLRLKVTSLIGRNGEETFDPHQPCTSHLGPQGRDLQAVFIPPSVLICLQGFIDSSRIGVRVSISRYVCSTLVMVALEMLVLKSRPPPDSPPPPMLEMSEKTDRPPRYDGGAIGSRTGPTPIPLLVGSGCRIKIPTHYRPAKSSYPTRQVIGFE